MFKHLEVYMDEHLKPVNAQAHGLKVWLTDDVLAYRLTKDGKKTDDVVLADAGKIMRIRVRLDKEKVKKVAVLHMHKCVVLEGQTYPVSLIDVDRDDGCTTLVFRVNSAYVAEEFFAVREMLKAFFRVFRN